MIRVRELRKVYKTRFGEKLVFDGINFDLEMGERLGILGRNGAGKSTLVRLISGAELPTEGTIERGMSISWPLAFGGAFQPQLTGIDNIRFISRVYEQDAERNIAFVEDFAELGPYLREPVITYSSGMRARLAFAISMIIEFDCFLIDEISAVGDARFHERCNLELFEKRGDRAMIIISHDAAYIRDHCNRFAVLHDSKLMLFDRFEAAYSYFRESIGLDAQKRRTPEEWPLDRRQLIETTHIVAVLDDAFRVIVQSADWKRDDGLWEEAEAAYAEALELYPYQRSYWVQRAHVAKEQGADVRAEIGYRTAIALGEPYSEVREHLEFVMQRHGVDPAQYPARIYSGDAAPRSVPSAPDIHLLARAAWSLDEVEDEFVVQTLRECGSCDDVLARMLSDPRHQPAQDQGAGGEPSSSDQGQDISGIPNWAADLVTIACPHLTADEKHALASTITQSDHIWVALRKAGGFDGWDALASVEPHLVH